jgi:hypothetical protein
MQHHSLDWLKQNDLQTAIGLLDRIEPYYVFTVIAIGLVGNTISFLLFVSAKFK